MAKLISDDMRKRIVARWKNNKESGMTWAEFAKPFGISASRYREILVEEGVELPSKAEHCSNIYMGVRQMQKKLRTGQPYQIHFGSKAR